MIKSAEFVELFAVRAPASSMEFSAGRTYHNTRVGAVVGEV